MPYLNRAELHGVITEFLVEQLSVEPADVTEEASFQNDLDADSLDLVEVIMEMEDRFGIKIPDEAAQKMATVGDSLDYLEAHQPSDGYKVTKKGEDGTAGVREPAPASPSGGAGGATAEEAIADPAETQ